MRISQPAPRLDKRHCRIGYALQGGWHPRKSLSPATFAQYTMSAGHAVQNGTVTK
jgi:hypothetical protein